MVCRYSGGGGDPDITRVDDVVIDSSIITPTESGSWSLVKSLY